MGGRLLSAKSSESAKQLDAGSVDWELANSDAVDWARQYGSQLVGGITETTLARLQKEIASFVESGDLTINQLQQRIAPIFGNRRAELIASTEVTRAFAQGNLSAWRESGFTEGKEWNTSQDELVCPICGPLDGEVVALDATFPGGFDGPPAHPRCRCSIAPVPVQLGADFTVADEIALIERGSIDMFANIRPPEGRAPRGLGAEYGQRRRIIRKIESHIKWRAQAQAQLERYRGQTGVRNRWRINVAQERVGQLNKGISTMLDIANDAITTDWGFKTELIDGIAEHISVARVAAA
jgi:SPP1 gp7 family putative phage head morphogenesis protein